MGDADQPGGDHLVAVGVELGPGLGQLLDAGLVQCGLVRPKPVDARLLQRPVYLSLTLLSLKVPHTKVSIPSNIGDFGLAPGPLLHY